MKDGWMEDEWMDGWMNDGYTRGKKKKNHFFIEFQFPTQPWWLA
jgi:hypothetical protein